MIIFQAAETGTHSPLKGLIRKIQQPFPAIPHSENYILLVILPPPNANQFSFLLNILLFSCGTYFLSSFFLKDLSRESNNGMHANNDVGTALK